MEKIIVRNKVTKKSYITSNFIRLTEDYGFNSIDDFIKKYSLINIMRELFEEEIESEALKDTLIYKKYIEIVDYGKENKYFKIMYKLNDEFCVSIKEHIYLYHLVPMIEINNYMILPWNYVDSKMYIGDTWWQDDEEILGDLKKLSIIDFIKKYKAY